LRAIRSVSAAQAAKTAQGRQGGVDRGRLLTLAEFDFELAQVEGGRLRERGVVVLLEPGGETLQVGDVLAGGALANILVSSARKAGNGLSDEQEGLAGATTNASEKNGGPARVLDSSLKAYYPTNLNTWHCRTFSPAG
jgi:hypothetical protein